MLSFFPRGVLDEILNLIESVSEGFPSYSCNDRVVFLIVAHPASFSYHLTFTNLSVLMLF